MTDNEIIKALECCFNNDWNKTKCNECPFYNGGGSCVDELKKSTFDFINRQKERIEELEKSELSKAMTFNGDTIKRCSAEAIREFAKFLIDKSENGVISASDIPGFVKEMTEENL